MAKDQPVAHGGQAVIEGVAMRGKKVMATAVRRADGRIVVDKQAVAAWGERVPFLKWPLVRGSVAMLESLVVGTKALVFSASQFAEGEDVEFTGKDTTLVVLLAFAVTVLVFIALPAFLVRLLQPAISATLVLNLVEGLIKVVLFVAYVGLIGLFPDIRRVFEYHGAEHKTINAYEAGDELTVEQVRRHTTLHYRCGSSFILLVLLISILIFSLVTAAGRPPFWERFLIHLAILPLVAGVSYELIRYASRKDAFFLFRWLASPGLLVQLLTTRQPDDSQLEVAIRALDEVLAGTGDDAPAGGVVQ
ncbi:MAG TPA: DUF1385 domain-containing protein [Firmicutes bacterium]|nr:DUF1385 domain-containing protein [Bacillota bacterium]